MVVEQPPHRAHLATWPTPLEPAPRLARAIGLDPDDLWIKRDDLIGLGGGGNKVRKLEWIAGTAQAGGATTLVTSGAAQSNHARLTAAAGAKLGMDVVLVLAGSPSSAESGNVALDGLLGARIVWAGDRARAELDSVVDEVAESLDKQGAVVAVVPFGGSSPLGARGYVDAGHELLEQCPDVSSVVVAVGSGGTMAGLVHALGPERVLGVDCGAVVSPEHTVAQLVGSLSASHDAPPLRIRHDQVGTGYATPGDTVFDAMLTAARHEGVVLDPIYTGRAMAGLIAAADDGQLRAGQRTIFVHTGGMPGLFGHPATLARVGREVRDASTTGPAG